MKLYFIREEDGTIRNTDDVLEWGRWIDTANRVLAKDEIGDVRVVTFFIGLSLNAFSEHPTLWETMVFGSKKYLSCECEYTSEAAALEGHRKAVAMVQSGIDAENA